MAIMPGHGSNAGDNARGLSVGIGVRVGEAVAVTVGVFVIVGVNACDVVPTGGSVAGVAGANVLTGVCVIVGMEAMIAAVRPGDVPNARVALSEETSWVRINTKATRAATISRDANDLLK
jgi:hypothetical protein